MCWCVIKLPTFEEKSSIVYHKHTGKPVGRHLEMREQLSANWAVAFPCESALCAGDTVSIWCVERILSWKMITSSLSIIIYAKIIATGSFILLSVSLLD